jgi:1-phosphofructokinase/tagatose 6-phosphate kinase
MIVTVTLNAAQDRTISVPNFHVGGRNRASESLTQPGGKGVNVARALLRLGQPVIATGLAGGRVGTYIIEALTAEGILNDFVRITEESRTSTAVIDPTGQQQTEINELGPAVAEHELAVLLDKISYLAKGAEIFVLAGSLPPDVPLDFYESVLRTLNRECMTVLDASGPALRRAIAAGPSLVSPNVREAEEVVGHEFGDPAEMVDGARSLVAMGAAGAVIHGADGCVAYVVPHGETRPRSYIARLPARTPLSTIGSGDSFLAGLLAAWYRRADVTEALARAVATGAANTLKLGAGVFDLEDVEALARQVKVEMVE